MKTADELFKELGYEKYDNHPEFDDEQKCGEEKYFITQDCRCIEYTKKSIINETTYTTYINFHPISQVVELGGREINKELNINRYRKPFLVRKELKAINKKCEELGWKE